MFLNSKSIKLIIKSPSKLKFLPPQKFKILSWLHSKQTTSTLRLKSLNISGVRKRTVNNKFFLT